MPSTAPPAKPLGNVEPSCPPPPATLSAVDLCAARLKVLADPTRLATMGHLLRGPLHVNELGDRLGIEQSLLSHHLKVLRDTGLVLAERDGKAVLYRVAPDVAVGPDATSINIGCCAIVFNPPDGKE